MYSQGGGARRLSLLEVSGIVMRFGGVVALDGPSFDVEEGRICGLIGPNGAGKTTLFNCVSRLYTPAGGLDHVRRRGPAAPSARTTSPASGSRARSRTWR